MDDPEENLAEVDFGERVFDGDGNELGTVRGFIDDGIIVTTRDGIESLSIEHVRSGHEFGAAELMWRCLVCGEMGELDDELPGECPNCGAQREEIYYWTED